MFFFNFLYASNYYYLFCYWLFDFFNKVCLLEFLFLTGVKFHEEYEVIKLYTSLIDAFAIIQRRPYFFRQKTVSAQLLLATHLDPYFSQFTIVLKA